MHSWPEHYIAGCVQCVLNAKVRSVYPGDHLGSKFGWYDEACVSVCQAIFRKQLITVFMASILSCLVGCRFCPLACPFLRPLLVSVVLCHDWFPLKSVRGDGL